MTPDDARKISLFGHYSLGVKTANRKAICCGSPLIFLFFLKICRMVMCPVRGTYNHVQVYFAQNEKTAPKQSVDGSGNFKITKFFEVKTGKCSKLIFLTLFSPCERPKSIPFFI